MDAKEHNNWRGVFQEHQQKDGFLAPVYHSEKSASGNWDIRIFFNGNAETKQFEKQFVFSAPITIVRKKDAERMASKALLTQLSSSSASFEQKPISSAVDVDNGREKAVVTSGTKGPELTLICDVETSPWIIELVPKLPEVKFVLYGQKEYTTSVKECKTPINYCWVGGETIGRDAVVKKIMFDLVDRSMFSTPVTSTAIISSDIILRYTAKHFPNILLFAKQREMKDYFSLN